MKIFELFRYANYTKLYFASFISEIGSFITETGIMLFVFSKSGNDKSYLGMTRAVFLFFFVVGALLGGTLGERFNRRNILILCDVARIPVIFAILWSENIPIIMLSNGLIAFFTGIFNPTRLSLINDFVPPKSMRYANALFAQTLSTLNIVGPFLGAMIYTQTGRIVEILYFDLMTYLLGIILLLRVNFVFTKSRPLKAGVFANLKKIFSYTVKRRELLSLYLNTLITGCVIGILIPLFLPFVREALRGNIREYSYIITAFGIGGLFGGVFFNRLLPFMHEGKIIVTSTIVEVTLFNLWIRINNFTASFCIMLLWGIVVLLRYSAQLNYLSKSVESVYLTQSYSFLELCFLIPNIFGGITIGLVGTYYDTLKILEITGILFGAVMILRLLSGELKKLYTFNVPQVDRSDINYR